MASLLALGLAILAGNPPQVQQYTPPTKFTKVRGTQVHDLDDILLPGYRIFLQEDRPRIAPIRHHLHLIPPSGPHREILSLNDLGGGMNIRSKANALAFARLRSSYMFDLPQPLVMEINLWGKKNTQGGYLVPAQYWKQLYRYPLIERTHAGFTVTRVLLAFGGKYGVGTNALVKEVETITIDGHWTETDEPVHGPLAKLGLAFPLP